MNLEGKKQYDREFLIKLQYDSLSLTKPEHLPNMEIVKVGNRNEVECIMYGLCTLKLYIIGKGGGWA